MMRFLFVLMMVVSFSFGSVSIVKWTNGSPCPTGSKVLSTSFFPVCVSYSSPLDYSSGNLVSYFEIGSDTTWAFKRGCDRSDSFYVSLCDVVLSDLNSKIGSSYSLDDLSKNKPIAAKDPKYTAYLASIAPPTTPTGTASGSNDKNSTINRDLSNKKLSNHLTGSFLTDLKDTLSSVAPLILLVIILSLILGAVIKMMRKIGK